MKLGILTVYLIDDKNLPLVELQLKKLEETTSVPYTIFAAAARTEKPYRTILEKNPKVKICDVEKTDLRFHKEHSHYLEHLIDHALQTDVTHMAIFHADSFPIKDSWFESMKEELEQGNEIASVYRDTEEDYKPSSCFLFFTREWAESRPPLLENESLSEISDYKKYAVEHPHNLDTGWGWGWYLRDKKWHKLRRSNKGEDHFVMGSIYGDLIFHFTAGTRVPRLFRHYRLHDPDKLKDKKWMEAQIEQDKKTKEEIKQKLIADPEGYLNFLRKGKI